MTNAVGQVSDVELGASREQLRLLATQASRSLVPLFFADLFLLWLTSSVGELQVGVAWFAVTGVLQVGRRRFATKLLASPPPLPEVAQAWRQMNTWFLLIGLARASLLPFFFQHSESTARYTVNYLQLGLAAGGSASVVGSARTYLMWAVPIFTTLIGGWLWTGGVEGYTFALLISMMLPLILGAIKDQYKLLRESIKIREQNQELLISLESERDKVRAASESRTRFFAAASHDLRQPLHALSLHAATLALVARDPGTRRVSEQFNRSLAHANSLLEGLIDISRLDANAVKVRTETFPVEDLFRALRDEFEIDCDRRQLRLDLQQADAPLWIRADPELTLRILRNLVGNAVKFTDKGAITINVAPRGDDHIELTVADTGVGIPADEQQRVFEEFYQLGNPGRDRSIGLGLGLSIVRRLTDMMETPMTLASVPGAGTTFTLMFKRGIPDDVTTTHEIPPDFASRPLRVLMIDDEEQVVAAASGFLQEIGWECTAVDTGVNAFGAMRAGFQPDAMVVDVRLGAENGIQLARNLRAEFGDIPVLLVTGETAPDQLLEISQSGFPVLTKPVDGTRLAQAIAHIAGSQGVAHADQSEPIGPRLT